jgi:hypothetical protein
VLQHPGIYHSPAELCEGLTGPWPAHTFCIERTYNDALVLRLDEVSLVAVAKQQFCLASRIVA